MSTAGNRGAGFPHEQRTEHGQTGSRPRTEDTSLTGTASRLAGNVKDKAQDLASGASDLAGQVRDKAQDLAGRVGDTAQQTWQSTQEMAGNLADRAGDWMDDMTGLVRRYPIASLFCAFGLGFVLAKGLEAMMSNRSSSY